MNFLTELYKPYDTFRFVNMSVIKVNIARGQAAYKCSRCMSTSPVFCKCSLKGEFNKAGCPNDALS